MNKIFAGVDPDYLFWSPEPDDVVLVGPEQRQVPLPQMPLPIHPQALEETERPADDAIGLSAYDYLRRYPDAEGGRYLAELLRDAYPHFLADIASQVIMLDEKEVDAPYIQRKIAGLKILALLDPKPQLLELIGKAYLDLGLMFTELAACRLHFQAAAAALQRVLADAPRNPSVLNQLAQIAWWFGDHQQAEQLWHQAAAQLQPGPVRIALLERAAGCAAPVPERTLVDELELLGSTLPLIGHGEYAEACAILEDLAATGRVVVELPMPEFHHLLGYCREQCGHAGSATIAYQRALELDPHHQPAREGLDRVTGRQDHV